MHIIPLYRVRLALGIVADSLRKVPYCFYATDLQKKRYALSIKKS